MEDYEAPDSLREFFEKSLLDVCGNELGLNYNPSMTQYLVRLLCLFAREDGLFPFRDEKGLPIKQVGDLLQYGDIRYKAQSFEQERLVHRHIGDLILFASAFFPPMLSKIGLSQVPALKDSAYRQGTESYYVASTFNFPPHDGEARVLRSLSDEFEFFSLGLAMLRTHLPGFMGRSDN